MLTFPRTSLPGGAQLELVFTVSAYAILLIQHQNGAIDRPIS